MAPYERLRFHEFRTWIRGARTFERAGSAIAALVVAALLVWLLAPGNEAGPGNHVATAAAPSQEAGLGATATTAEPGAPGAPSSVGAADGDKAAPGGGASSSAVVGSAGAAAAGPTGAGASRSAGSGPPAATSVPGSASPTCTSPPGTAKGISGREVHIAIALTEIVGPAANQVFDVASPAQQRANFDAIVAGINREGGAACRKLVADYVTANPADESQMVSLCRQVADQDIFAIVDTGALASRPSVLNCFGQRSIPFFGALYIPDTLRLQFYPYIYSLYTKEVLYRTSAFAFRDVGFFDPAKGFKKLGFIYKDCNSQSIAAFRGWIREAGVPDALVVPYSVGCPSAFANPADLQAAVLTFRREGVTHVTAAEFQGDLPRFTTVAEQQGFRPKYGLPDENIIALSSGTLAPDPNNIVDAIAITSGRDAENRTPGMTMTAGTQRCDAYLRAAGLAPTWQQDATAGNGCDQVWMLQNALNHAPDLSRAALVQGLQRTKSIDFSYPQGPNDLSGSRVTTGGQFWRVATFSGNCKCWQVTQREFRHAY